MKLRKLFLLTFFFSLFSVQNLAANTSTVMLNGMTLSDKIYDFLSSNNFNPQMENIVSKGKNNFPYNIIVNFNHNLDIKKNVIFVFNQDEAYENQELIKDFCLECKDYNFPVTILFSYDCDSAFEDSVSLSGIFVFLENELDTTLSSTAFIIHLSEERNSIDTASNGKTSPSWLIKSVYNLILKNNLDFNLPPYYLSQLYTFKFSHDRNLDAFFNADIPCIKLSFEKNEKWPKMSHLLKDILYLFNENTPMNFDQHFLIISFFGTTYFRMNEQFLVICVISIILVFLLFLFLLFFIDSHRRNGAFIRLKNNWHPLVFTYIIILASFLLGKGGFLLIQQNITSISRIFVLYVFQMIISLILSFVFFTYEFFHNTKINAAAVEYTVILATFLNQFFFLYNDISLFPLFFITCILSVAAKYIRKPQFQIPVLVLMIFPFLIYVYLLLGNSQIGELKNFLLQSEKSIFALSLIISPFYLQLDCIFIEFAQRAKNKKQILTTTSIIVSAFCLLIIILSGFYSHLGKKNDTEIKAVITKSDDEASIICTWNDSHVFDDTIRNLSLTIPKEALSCNVQLKCEEGAPILYSDNTFVVMDKNTSVFVIPSNPPETMWFSFGISDKPMTITVTIICPDSEENQFIMKEKTVKIDS